MVVLTLASACGDAPSDENSTTTVATSRTTSGLSEGTTMLDSGACALVSEADLSALAGVEMTASKETPTEFSASSCTYESVAPADPSAGRVLKLVLVDIYSGSQFFDIEGTFYPLAEREYLDIGDDAFVHIGDAVRGVTVQVSIEEAVLSINYTEQAILTDEVADAASKAAALVALVKERLND